MSLLENNLKTDIRATIGDYIIKNPTNEQVVEIEKMLKETSTINNEMTVKTKVDDKLIRYLLKNTTNIGEEINKYDNKQLDFFINNGNRDTINLMKEMTSIITEIVEDIQFLHNQQMKNVVNMIDSLVATMEVKKTESLLNSMLKDNGIDATLSDLIPYLNNQNKLQKVIKKKTKKKV